MYAVLILWSLLGFVNWPLRAPQRTLPSSSIMRDYVQGWEAVSRRARSTGLVLPTTLRSTVPISRGSVPADNEEMGAILRWLRQNSSMWMSRRLRTGATLEYSKVVEWEHV